MNEKIYFAAAFLIGVAMSAEAVVTFSQAGCDVEIHAPTYLYHDAIDAGVREWVSKQCGTVQ